MSRVFSKGDPYDIEIEFPIERGVMFCVKIIDKQGREIQRVQHELPSKAMKWVNSNAFMIRMIKSYIFPE